MAYKKYDFAEILKECNKKHGTHHKLNKQISNAMITCDIGNNSFMVSYTCDDASHKRGILDFVYYNVSTSSLFLEDIIDIIQHKGEDSLNLRIEIWPSSKISYAYLQSNYHAPNVGNLGKSCMRLEEMQKALNFYIKNRTKIVVVVDSNNKIHARALLWDNVRSIKLKTPFTYLDRVYARSDTFLCLFYDLAKENKWKWYPTVAVNCMDKNYYKEDIYAAGMCHLPFMDTFRYLYHKDNLLTASRGLGISKNSDSYTALNEYTNRGYYPSLDPDRVLEAISNKYISKKDAIFVKRYDAYVLKKNVADINGTYYSTFDKKVVKTKIDGYILKEDSVTEALTGETIDKNNAIQSAKYEGYIHKSNIIHIWDEIYHKSDNNVIHFDNKWYHISQCFINYNRVGVNDDLATQTGYTHCPQDYTPYWRRTRVNDKNSKYIGLSRKGNLIPKEHAIIAYDLVYNPIVDDIEYQKVYCTDRKNLILLITGELIINSPENKQHLKKFSNKWYIKQNFRLPDKNQLLLLEDKK